MAPKGPYEALKGLYNAPGNSKLVLMYILRCAESIWWTLEAGEVRKLFGVLGDCEDKGLIRQEPYKALRAL